MMDKVYVSYADDLSLTSVDSTKVACLIVRDSGILSRGINCFPEGVVVTEKRQQRPDKYKWTEHAERNAIYRAAKKGVSLDGATAYTNWFPCSDCARALIQCGIKRVVGRKPTYDHTKYGEDFVVALEMLTEAGLEVTYVD